MTKRYRFFLHYNKPLSKQKGEHIWSVHFRNKCYFTPHIDCTVATESKTNSRQPFVVMRGMATEIEILEDKLIIR